ncbi:nucleolar protein,Nop52-domain-containing protein [Achaetomium macrosporum]|uniref:Nucleolar protein,Nop52-domain-containing protein n=1 Tax=Achaetomium macrosporum TaxID=79813 RepID=A0AAN7C4E2_9PEZI|nr:nucleolar protein,Nop52-domain-containing protein [Achaetomium macrosporum]
MASGQSMPFIKTLASSDRKIRTSALSSLHAFLSARQVASSLTPLDVLKLWKGLFYALWMCDRAIPQQNLCNELADLIYILPREATVPWLRGFWATMSREWTGIDVLRMEKFLLLVRRVVGAGFKWMRRGNTSERNGKEEAGASPWDASKVEDVLGLLGEWPFALEEEALIEQITEEDGQISQKIPVGLRLHVLDIWVDEAEKAGLLDDDDEEAKQIIQSISEQIDALEQATTSPAVRARSKESLADDRLPGNRKQGDEAQGDEDAKDAQGDGGSWDGFDD